MVLGSGTQGQKGEPDMIDIASLQRINPGLTIEELRKAAAREVTPEERREQMISFIMGTVSSNSTITREEVARFLDENPW